MRHHHRNNIPIALTIAGSDSGGGAGIQADLKTFAALGVHGTSAITCLTAQNPKRVLEIDPCSSKILRRQLEAIFQELRPAAIKTGMLFSAANIKTIAEFIKTKASQVPLVVDPVLISTSGAKLLQPSALKVLRERLLPLATLITPNLFEAEALCGQKIGSLDEMSIAAQKIHSRWGCAVLIKGGHLCGSRDAKDLFYDGRKKFTLSVPFVKGIQTHGTGCVYSAAICAALAQSQSLPQAVRTGKWFITRAIRNSYRISGHFALAIQP